MAKSAYAGVASVARKSRKMYVGVANIARKVKKIYVGVAGVARLFFSSGGEFEYLGIGTALSHLHYSGAAVTFNNNAVFIGGQNGTGQSTDYLEYYNSSLTKGSSVALNSYGQGCNGTKCGDILLIVGGYNGSSYSAQTRMCTASFTLSFTWNAVEVARYQMAAASVGGYALYAGGSDTNGSSKTVTAYTASVTASLITGLSANAYSDSNLRAGAATSNHAAFAMSGYVDFYNSALTKTPVTANAASPYKMTRALDDKYIAVLTQTAGIVEIFDSSLTKRASITLSTTLSGASMASTGENLLISAKAYHGVIDSSLTLTEDSSKGISTSSQIAAVVGSNVLIADGTTVHIYKEK